MIKLDYKNDKPLHEQIEQGIRSLIINGVLEKDEQLPSVRSLAVDLSINANTIQRAYSELERRGLIYSVKGRGNFVSSQKEVVIEQQEELLNQLKQQFIICKESGIEFGQVLDCLRETFQEVMK